MRKFLIMITALATLSFLAGVASAGTIQIGGTHSPDEIKTTCEKNGGIYNKDGDLYGCWNSCKSGEGSDFCSVACIGGKRLGTCQTSCTGMERQEYRGWRRDQHGPTATPFPLSTDYREWRNQVNSAWDWLES